GSAARRLVELEARDPRAPPSVDDRAAAGGLAGPFPEALRSRGASGTGAGADRASERGRIRALAPAPFAPRDGRRDRDRRAHVPHLPTRPGAGACGRAPRDAEEPRSGRGGGRREPGALARAPRGPARPRRRRAARAAGARNHAALALRLVPVAPRPHPPPVRVRLPDRGLHPGTQADPRLLLAADLPRRAPDRPPRRKDSPRRGAT